VAALGRSSAPPPLPGADGPDTIGEAADTRRGSDLEIAAALCAEETGETPIPPSSTSGIVERSHASSTLASGANPVASPADAPSAPPVSTPTAPPPAPAPRAVPVLVAIVLALIAVVAVLSRR
jgi:hypothetical protein